MKISFANEKIAEICCTNDDHLLQKYIKKQKAPHAPDDIRQVLDDLYATPTVNDLPPMYNYHLLSHNRSGLAAVDVKVLGIGGRGLWRMILRPVSDCGDINRKVSIKEVIVESILENYHKGKG